MLVTLASEMNEALLTPNPGDEAEKRSLRDSHAAAVSALEAALEALDAIKPEPNSYSPDKLQTARAHHLRRVAALERVRAEVVELAAAL